MNDNSIGTWGSDNTMYIKFHTLFGVHCMQEEAVHPPGMKIPAEIIAHWKNLVDLLLMTAGVKAAFIMRIVEDHIHVLVSSESNASSFKRDYADRLLGSRLFCDTVIKSKEALYIPDALSDETWKNTRIVQSNYISYLGFPIILINGSPYGTICILDDKENHYSENTFLTITNFKDIIQNQLKLLSINQMLKDENTLLNVYLSRNLTLENVITICCYCKNVRNDNGDWSSIERYLTSRTNIIFSHGICSKCFTQHFPEIPD